jgi:hypothetical protein
MAGNELHEPPGDSGYPTTWAGALCRIVDVAAESPWKLAVVCTVILVAGAVAIVVALVAAHTGLKIF